MRIHQIQHSVFIDCPIEKVWSFFSDPHNLAKITPAYMDFTIVACPEVPEIFEGMLIEYRIKPVLGIPVKWTSIIENIEPLASFTDRQLKGPYAYWEHKHSFRVKDRGTIMDDVVRYALPLGILGDIAHNIFVKKQLRDIFLFREQAIKTIQF